MSSPPFPDFVCLRCEYLHEAFRGENNPCLNCTVEVPAPQPAPEPEPATGDDWFSFADITADDYCPTCKGKGGVNGQPCPSCAGWGSRIAADLQTGETVGIA